MSEAVELETTAHVPAKRSRKVEIEAAAPVAMDEATALVALIERAAKDPSVDLDKMERLFRMHEALTAKRAEAAFNSAMADAQAKLVPVAKKLTNTHTRSKYADLAAISEAAMPIVHSRGFGLSFGEFKSELPGHIGISCKVTHAAGHSERYEFNIPVDAAGSQGKVNKTATQAYGSTTTYGRRYATCMVFNIATKNDTDGSAPEVIECITDAQVAELEKLIADTKSDKEKFLRLGNVTALADIPAANFDKAKGLLTAKLKAMGAAS